MNTLPPIHRSVSREQKIYWLEVAEDKLCLIRIIGWPLSYTVHEAILRKTEIKIRIKNNRDFTGGAVVKNQLPANAGDTVRALVRKDPTCHGATKPGRHNY